MSATHSLDEDISHGRASFYLGDMQQIAMDLPSAYISGMPLTQAYEAADYSDDGESQACDGRKIIVGICAMSKKSKSQPMQEILERLDRFEYIQTLVFDEDVILNEPVERWPICDCLISFYSKGFCLDKAIEYEKLRHPFTINDLPMQYGLQDRREVYQILKENDIDHPRFAVLDREKGYSSQVMEGDDQIEVHGVVFQKPFVEKPVSAEDHNVYIYFPTSAGGGSQRLFRKIGSRSSVYSPVSRIRKAGSYIYEDFMPTDGTDVKVYTLGPDYAHAEARKSPALDGKVERDKNGKEVRYPVILNAAEKMMARKVCLAFKQTVCGFDLLRANGRSYVCDVNGFSFVKNSNKYYDDSAKILGNMIMKNVAPQLSIPWSIAFPSEDIPIVPTTYGTMMELRCVIAVIRHGDRTPKQKMKMEVKHRKFFDLFEKYNGYGTGHLKLKRPKQLQEVLDISRYLLAELNTNPDLDIEEKKSKLEQLKSVLEMYGHFSGINRKVQLKYQPNGRPKRSSSEEGFVDDSTYSGTDYESDAPREPSLVLILKWGGELTPAGKVQAEELGKAFRCMYPGGEGDYGQCPGLGLLRLHSTFRHDLKIYASDEGRVQMTAAAFAKGLLALEGELTPILVQMVKSANTNGLLDNDNQCLSKYQNIAKEKLRERFHQDCDFREEDYEKLAPTGSASLINAMKFIKNPYRMCQRVYELISKLTRRIKELKSDAVSKEKKLYHGETWELMMRRWGKLEKDFKQKNGRFDISKIPDIYDCIKYDVQHNQNVLRFEQANELHTCSKALADIIVPQEYGITKEEKIQIAQSICTPLLKKIHCDLERNTEDESTRLDARYSKGVSTPHRHVRTRLYFTSESHIHSLLTLIKYGELCDQMTDQQWQRAMDYVSAISELNYMTQIVIMMYEDPTKDTTSEERFHVELHFSPGAQTCDTDIDYPSGSGYRSQLEKKKHKDDDTSSSALVEESGSVERHVRIISPSITPESTSSDDLNSKQKDDASFGSETLHDKDHSLSSSMETLKSPSTDSLTVGFLESARSASPDDAPDVQHKARTSLDELKDVSESKSDENGRKRLTTEGKELVTGSRKTAKLDVVGTVPTSRTPEYSVDATEKSRNVTITVEEICPQEPVSHHDSSTFHVDTFDDDDRGAIQVGLGKMRTQEPVKGSVENLECDQLANDKHDLRRRHHSDPEKVEKMDVELTETSDHSMPVPRRKSSSPIGIAKKNSKVKHKSEENLSITDVSEHAASVTSHSQSFEEQHSQSFEESRTVSALNRRREALSAGLANAASDPNITRVNRKLALSFRRGYGFRTAPDSGSLNKATSDTVPGICCRYSWFI